MVNPCGRLPITWPKKYTDLSFSSDVQTWPGSDGKVIYKEQSQIGYRWFMHSKVRPQWWFGFGLSYTQFVSSLAEPIEHQDYWQVSVCVRNVGSMQGSEVVQLYAWPASKPGDIILVSFERTPLIDVGDSFTVTLRAEKRDMARWDDFGKMWRLTKGHYVFGVGLGVGDEGMASVKCSLCKDREWSSGY